MLVYVPSRVGELAVTGALDTMHRRLFREIVKLLADIYCNGLRHAGQLSLRPLALHFSVDTAIESMSNNKIDIIDRLKNEMIVVLLSKGPMHKYHAVQPNEHHYKNTVYSSRVLIDMSAVITYV